MNYSAELEEQYKNAYQGYEDPAVGGDQNTARDAVLNLNVNHHLNIFYNAGWYGDNIAYWNNEYEVDEDYTQKLYEETNIAFFRLPQHEDFYLGLADSIAKIPAWNNDDALPPSFYEAIERNAFKRNINNTISDYTGLNKEMKTRADLPADFIEGIKTGEIKETHGSGGNIIHSWAFFYMKLPLSFYEALKRNAFKIKINGTLTDYTGLNEDMKNYSDLPADFIAGVKSGEIILNPEKDDHLIKECLSNFTASICRKLPTRPLLLLAYGDHTGHASSYIARISEDNHCELLSLNSCEAYSKPDKLFIESLKEGVKKGLGLNDEDFDEPIYKVVQQRSFVCVYITSILLSLIDPNKALSEQVKSLVEAMTRIIENDKLARRLIARILWWNNVVNSKHVKNAQGRMEYVARDTKDLEQSMHELFRQLMYHVCKQPAPSKISLSENPEIFKECAKFLNIFNIKVNDSKFLKLFNKVEEHTLDEVSEETVEFQEKYFDRNDWATNKESLTKKLFDESTEVSEALKSNFQNALDDLARHARLNLDSTFTTKRALAGRKKYEVLSNLFQESENLEDLQNNIRKFLEVKNPDNSPLLKNRGGFFGAYKTFSRAANFLGAEHYEFGTRTAVSRTDHYLIALYDSIDKVNNAKDDHSDSKNTNSSEAP